MILNILYWAFWSTVIGGILSPAWTAYAWTQIISVIAMIAGWLLLVPFCVTQAWKVVPYSYEGFEGVVAAQTDTWVWGPLNWVYGNPSTDGVSGAHARIWEGGVQVPYMPGANPSWRAYKWSALRNSADNLKYVFRWEHGPLFTKTYSIPFSSKQRVFKMGWQRENGVKVPVFSL